MKLSTWIVTEVRPDDPQASVHFAVAVLAEKARDLVARRTRIPPENLSVVRLWMELSPVPPRLRRSPDTERYLGPLERFSPFLRDSCTFCRGTGKVIGSKPPEPCLTCGGSGLRTVKRA